MQMANHQNCETKMQIYFVSFADPVASKAATPPIPVVLRPFSHSSTLAGNDNFDADWRFRFPSGNINAKMWSEFHHCSPIPK